MKGEKERDSGNDSLKGEKETKMGNDLLKGEKAYKLRLILTEENIDEDSYEPR